MTSILTRQVLTVVNQIAKSKADLGELEEQVWYRGIGEYIH